MAPQLGQNHTMDTTALFALMATLQNQPQSIDPYAKFAQLVHQPVLTNIVAVASPLSGVWLCEEPKSAALDDYSFDAPPLEEGMVMVSAEYEPLPVPEWDY